MSFAFSSHVLRAASSAALRAGRSCGAHTATRARCASVAACPHPAATPRHSAAAAHAYACLVHRRSMVARSSPAGGPGQVSGALMESMTAKISAALGTSDVSVKDQGGDGRHVSIDVVSSMFEGKSAVDRQRMVYKAIWQELQETVHAVDSMTTRAPSEV